MRNFLFVLAVLIVGAFAARADDGMNGGWCPTDGWVYELRMLDSFQCVENGGGTYICIQNYECIQLYMLCRVERAPRVFGRDPMEVDRTRRLA